MASFRALLCFLLSTFWLYSRINAAAVNNLIYGNELANVGGLGDRSESFIALRESIRARRTIDDEGQSNTLKPCYGTTPCGWAVYVPFTRRIDYFMYNTCLCQTSQKCIRTDDDLSVSAYVYRCRDNATEADIESPDQHQE